MLLYSWVDSLTDGKKNDHKQHKMTSNQLQTSSREVHLSISNFSSSFETKSEPCASSGYGKFPKGKQILIPEAGDYTSCKETNKSAYLLIPLDAPLIICVQNSAEIAFILPSVHWPQNPCFFLRKMSKTLWYTRVSECCAILTLRTLAELTSSPVSLLT